MKIKESRFKQRSPNNIRWEKLAIKFNAIKHSRCIQKTLIDNQNHLNITLFNRQLALPLNSEEKCHLRQILIEVPQRV